MFHLFSKVQKKPSIKNTFENYPWCSNKVKDNQYFWTILKESVKKLRNRRPKKKKKGKEKQLLPKGMFQVTQNMIHSLLLG